jgi:hypothetical protein
LGATSYGTSYGAQALTSGGSTRSIGLEDGVPPSIVKARYRYSTAEVLRDTMIATLSEKWVGEAAGNVTDPFLTVGRPSSPTSFAPIKDWYLDDDGITLSLVVDTSWESLLSRGDSARLAHYDQGSRVWDAAGNEVGTLSRWVPIEFGLRPTEFTIKQEHSIVVNKGDNTWTEPASGVPSVEFLVKNDAGDWVTVDDNLQIDTSGAINGGSAAQNDISHVMIVYIKLNRPLDGNLFIYDNLGVGVTKVDLSPLAKLWTSETEDALREVRITWNGTDPKGKFVATGVYLLRAVVKAQDGEGKTYFQNLVWKYGWQHGTN